MQFVSMHVVTEHTDIYELRIKWRVRWSALYSSWMCHCCQIAL